MSAPGLVGVAAAIAAGLVGAYQLGLMLDVLTERPEDPPCRPRRRSPR